MDVIYHPESAGFFTGKVADLPQTADGASCYQVHAHDVPAYTQIKTHTGYATALPDMDFETYSEAGYIYDPEAGRCGKWESIVDSPPHGLGAVGAAAYAEHPSTEVVSLAYNLKDGKGSKLWLPGAAPPVDLFEHIAAGGLLEAHNSGFEWFIWRFVCFERMGWPHLPHLQLRCSMSKARAFSLPAQLGKLAEVTQVPIQKMEEGKRLIRKFCIPRTPTLKDDRLRIKALEGGADGRLFFDYNLADIQAESAASAVVPDLSPVELDLWKLDQTINFRGVAIDLESLEACRSIVAQAHRKYNAELTQITGGQVQKASELDKLKFWLAAQGLETPSLDKDRIAALVKRFNQAEDLIATGELPPDLHPVDREIITTYAGLPARATIKRALEIRQLVGSASVKKVASIHRRINSDGRIRDLFAYCGADRTDRFAGMGPQPQNLPNSGPDLLVCDDVNGCGKAYGKHLQGCPWCGAPEWAAESKEWGFTMVEDALAVIRLKDLRSVEHYYGDALAVVCGVLRGLFVAGPGKELICSDYSAIEAVVLAALAGEEWRLEVFRTHGKIYEMSAAKISGVPFQEFLDHKEKTGDHHPLRKKVGKVAELASGYQGGLHAWLAFGADKHLTEDEIKAAVKRWRAESPAIVKYWYTCQDAAINAVQYPGKYFQAGLVTFACSQDVLYCLLPSGRKLNYHQPRLTPDVTPWGKEVLKLSYMGYNSDYKKGPKGWLRMDTYGGRLVENITQSVARDILTHAMPRLEATGYDIVLHVHDEIAAEVDTGTGSVDEFEDIMADLPAWAAGWPIKAAGGWRGHRYRKD